MRLHGRASNSSSPQPSQCWKWCRLEAVLEVMELSCFQLRNFQTRFTLPSVMKMRARAASLWCNISKQLSGSRRKDLDLAERLGAVFAAQPLYANALVGSSVLRDA